MPFEPIVAFTPGLRNENSQSAIELLMAQPVLLENLRKAHMGNYGVILSLLGCLDHGSRSKKLVDKIVDASKRLKSIMDSGSKNLNPLSRSSHELA
ncbi:hypothetical protein C0993_005006 [Termitomyces sp. T159_Od127]|nr:hypothetical protein C0993_005006 [Termitomyces sp. T159_Od127]